MKRNSVKINFLLQMIYQIVILVVPLIIAPYLTRTLGDSSLGIYSYTYSIVSLFMVAARLGIDKHGQRLIAAVRDDEVKLRKSFWSLYCLHVAISVTVLIFYYIFCFCFTSKYKDIYIIQGFALLSIVFDITWFYYGIENIKLVVVENLCIKLIELFAIFIYVKDRGDLSTYAFIMSISLCLGYIIVLPHAFKVAKPVRFGWKDIQQHIKPLCILFGAVIATTLYQVIDKTLLGLFSTEANVAYYEYANKIVNVPVNLIYVIGTVLMPRACAYAAKGDTKNQIKYMDYSLHFVSFLGVGSLFGLLAVSNLFARIYYGQEFYFCGEIMMLLSPIIILLGLENITRTQFMIPNHMDKQYTICLWLTSFLHLFISAVLIPTYGIYGAVIGTIIAEVICTVLQLIICRSLISISKVFNILFPYIINGVFMYIAIGVIKKNYNLSITHLLIQVAVGAIVYMLLCCIYLLGFSDLKLMVRYELKKILLRIRM